MEDEFVIIDDDTALNLPVNTTAEAPQQMQRFQNFLDNLNREIERLTIEDWEAGMINNISEIPDDAVYRNKEFMKRVAKQIRDYEASKIKNK